MTDPLAPASMAASGGGSIRSIDFRRGDNGAGRVILRFDSASVAPDMRNDGKQVVVKSGRYGPYVTDGTINASLPRGADPASLTMEEAVSLLNARADKIAAALREKSIIVRHFKLPRIDQHLRITVGTDQECAALVQALQQPYRHGFVTDIESDSLPPGLDEGRRSRLYADLRDELSRLPR